jgi:hypothetical protein
MTTTDGFIKMIEIDNIKNSFNIKKSYFVSNSGLALGV